MIRHWQSQLESFFLQGSICWITRKAWIHQCPAGATNEQYQTTWDCQWKNIDIYKNSLSKNRASFKNEWIVQIEMNIHFQMNKRTICSNTNEQVQFRMNISIADSMPSYQIAITTKSWLMIIRNRSIFRQWHYAGDPIKPAHRPFKRYVYCKLVAIMPPLFIIVVIGSYELPYRLHRLASWCYISSGIDTAQAQDP